MTQEQVDYVEKETVGQSVNKLWHVQRARRVTTSNVKAASVTNPCMPSQSLIHVYVIYCYLLEDGDVAMRSCHSGIQSHCWQ